MIAHPPPPAVIQDGGSSMFVRISQKGRDPRYLVCGRPIEEGWYYILLAEWLRSGRKLTCQNLGPGPS